MPRVLDGRSPRFRRGGGGTRGINPSSGEFYQRRSSSHYYYGDGDNGGGPPPPPTTSVTTTPEGRNFNCGIINEIRRQEEQGSLPSSQKYRVLLPNRIGKLLFRHACRLADGSDQRQRANAEDDAGPGCNNGNPISSNHNTSTTTGTRRRAIFPPPPPSPPPPGDESLAATARATTMVTEAPPPPATPTTVATNDSNHTAQKDKDENKNKNSSSCNKPDTKKKKKFLTNEEILHAFEDLQASAALGLIRKDKWKENYKQLKKFRKRNGHCRVPLAKIILDDNGDRIIDESGTCGFWFEMLRKRMRYYGYKKAFNQKRYRKKINKVVGYDNWWLEKPPQFVFEPPLGEDEGRDGSGFGVVRKEKEEEGNVEEDNDNTEGKEESKRDPSFRPLFEAIYSADP